MKTKTLIPFAVAFALAGCSTPTGATDLPTSTPAPATTASAATASPSVTITPAETTPSAEAPAAVPEPAVVVEPTPLAIQDPVGTCTETASAIVPPENPWLTCTYGAMVIGHDLGPGTTGYLPSILPSLVVGATVTYAGRAWTVADRQSVPKEQLPDVLLDASQAGRWVVTCDPSSGYRTWADGERHANNNVVVRLDPQ